MAQPSADLKKQIFAQEYAANGHNGRQAALVAYPNQNPESASVTASQLLADPKVQSTVLQLHQESANAFEQASKKAIALLERLIDKMENNKEFAMLCSKCNNTTMTLAQAVKLLTEHGKLYATANTGPKTAIQNNKYSFPKR